MPSAPAFETICLDRVVVRVVEDQYVAATTRLVDDSDEQLLLEELVDSVKPPLPEGLGRLHFLLFTPFRYPSAGHGSRFRRRFDPGVFYAAEELRTALCETAYYRLVALAGTAAVLPDNVYAYTSFDVRVSTAKAVDLTAPKHRRRVSSATGYAQAQAVGARLRDAGIEGVRYVSARDGEGGANVALFAPVFADRQPRRYRGWVCTVRRDSVDFRAKNALTPIIHVFPKRGFLVAGKLPQPPQ